MCPDVCVKPAHREPESSANGDSICSDPMDRDYLVPCLSEGVQQFKEGHNASNHIGVCRLAVSIASIFFFELLIINYEFVNVLGKQ